MVKVLFVCLGNICRSPLAAGVFNQKIKSFGMEERFSTDSCGTSDFHIGELADERTINCAFNHDIHLKHRARQIQRQDFKAFDYIIVMDNKNLENVLELIRKWKINHKNLFLLRSFQASPASLEVPDPYYGDDSDFELVYDILNDSLDCFISFLKAKEHQVENS